MKTALLLCVVSAVLCGSSAVKFVKDNINNRIAMKK